jgi:type IV secretory pathway TraG/TraD family ATPase VirD4
MTLSQMTQPAVPGLHLAHLDRWVIAVAVVLAAAATLRAGLVRLAYGPRRPWLPFALRVRLRMRPGPGWAGRWQLWRDHGRPPSRAVARRARPSLPGAARRFGRWQQYATFLGWGQGWVIRCRVYAHLESLILTIAAPQEGKSQAATGQLIDAPGPVVATSIRGDLIGATAALRARHGQVHVWNPEHAGDCASTFSWNMVHGCADVTVAVVRRAGPMVEAVTARSLDSEAFWNDQASMVLAACLHAAALAGGDIWHVHAWSGGEDDTPLRILQAHPGASRAARDHLELYLSLPDRTRQSIAATLARVLKFLQLPACAEAVTVPGGGPGFDFGSFVTSRDTLYLVAADAATSPVTPLFAAVIAELAHAARQVGAASGAGRLDPPLTAVLDEVANIAPVPVAAWASWAAGSGIRLSLIAQSYAQLKQRWGADGAAVIWQCCKTKVIYGATSEDELGALVERACGTIRVRTAVREPGGWRREHEEVPLLPTAALRMLPAGRAVVIQGRAAPVIVRIEQARRRADYKRHRSRAALASPPALSPRPVPALTTGLRGNPADGPAIPDELMPAATTGPESLA